MSFEDSSAQDPPARSDSRRSKLRPTSRFRPGQGIAGGALVAGEVTVLTEALLGVETDLGVCARRNAGRGSRWLCRLPRRAQRRPDASAWLLGGGLAVLIPTVIWVGNARGTKRPCRQSRAASDGFSRAAGAAGALAPRTAFGDPCAAAPGRILRRMRDDVFQTHRRSDPG